MPRQLACKPGTNRPGCESPVPLNSQPAKREKVRSGLLRVAAATRDTADGDMTGSSFLCCCPVPTSPGVLAFWGRRWQPPPRAMLVCGTQLTWASCRMASTYQRNCLAQSTFAHWPELSFDVQYTIRALIFFPSKYLYWAKTNMLFRFMFGFTTRPCATLISSVFFSAYDTFH
jgi:hypothetical protein